MGAALVCSEEVLQLFPDHCPGSWPDAVSYRPYLNVYAHSDENEETAVIGLTGVNVECNPEMEALLGVSSISYALSVHGSSAIEFRNASCSHFSRIQTPMLSPRLTQRSYSRG